MTPPASKLDRVLASPWPPLIAYALLALWLVRGAAGHDYLGHRDGDGRMLFLPYMQFAATHLQQGDLPLWNPTMFGGLPHLALFLPGLCYPTTLLLAVLPAPAVFTGHIAVHLVLAGMGARAWSLQRGASPGGAAVAGLCWAFGWSVLGQAAWGTTPQVAALAWMPWTCCWAERAMDLVPGRVPRRADTVATAAGIMLVAFSGHIQYLYLTTLLLGLLALAGAIPLRRQWWRPFVRLAPAGLLGGLLAAPLLIPGVLFLAESSRTGGLAAGIAASYNLPPRHLLLLATPSILGPDSAGTLRYWGEWNAFDGIAALPLPALVLAACAPLHSGRLRGIGLAGGVGLLLALGAATPVYTVAEYLLPGLGSMRTPSRFACFAMLAAAMYAGHGTSALLGEGVAARRGGRRTAWIAGAATLLSGGLVVFLLAGGVQGGAWAWFTDLFLRSNDRFDAAGATSLGFMMEAHRHTVMVLVITCGLGLLTTGLGIYRAVDAAPPRLTAAMAFGCIAAGALASVGGALPTMSPAHLTLRFKVGETLQLADPQVRWVNDTNSPNIGMTDGSRALGGWGPMNTERTARLLERSEGVPRGTPLFVRPLVRPSPAWDAAAVRYVVCERRSRSRTPSPAEALADAPGWTQRLHETAYDVFERNDAVPRARLVYDAAVAASPEEALTWVVEGRHDPRRTVVLESPAPRPTGRAPAPGGSVAFTADTPDEVVLSADTPAPAILVLADSWASGWSVTVDGTPAAPLHADYGFRAVALPAGRHTVVWRYVPPGLTAGLLLALLGLLTGVALVIWERRARARHPGGAVPA